MRILTIILSLACVSAFGRITKEQFQETKKLAEQGDHVAQFHLGGYYETGLAGYYETGIE